MIHSRFERADDSPGFLLWQLTNLWQQRIRAALAPLGITHVQFVLLAGTAWLADSGIIVSQVILSRHARTDIMMTSEVVRALQKKGLVRRAVHPHDPRAKVVTLTAEGEQIIQQAMALVESADEQFFKELGEQAPTFVRSMQDLIKANADSQVSARKT